MFLNKRKSQTLAETAVFGTLVLLAFTILVTYLQKMNGEQYTLMENFRDTLKKSHDDNLIVSNAYLDDGRQADVENPLQGKRIMRSASGYAHWVVPDIDSPDSAEQSVIDTSDGGTVTKVVEESKPDRKFVYNFMADKKEEKEIDKDTDVEGVTVEYQTTLHRELEVDEDAAKHSSTLHSVVSENSKYILKGSEDVSYSRSDDGRRSLEAEK